MKSIIVFMTFILVFFTSCISPNIATRPVKPISFEKRMMVAVGDIQNQTGDTNYDAMIDGWTGNLIYELYDTQCFRLIERQKLKDILDDQKLTVSGLLNPAKTKEIGKLLGADAILFVNLAAIKYSSENKTNGTSETHSEKVQVSLDARLVAALSGEILAASKTLTSYEDEKTEPSAALKKCMEDSVKSLARDIAWQIPKESSKDSSKK